MLDILIRNAMLVTMRGKGAGFCADGAIAIKGDRIVAVGPTQEVVSQYNSAHREIDAAGKVVMPGLIDAHIHTGIGLLRGVAQDIDNWMAEGIWPFESRLRLDPDAVAAGSMANIAEAVKMGTTTFCDYDYPMQRIVENHVKIGSRAHVAELISEFPPGTSILPIDELYELNPSIGNRKLQENLSLIHKWEGYDSRITCMLGPQAPDMVSRELLLEVKSLAEKLDKRIHMHVSQGEREIRQMEMRYGRRSIPFLQEIGYLNFRLNAVHMTAATREETHFLAESGASMILCSTGLAILEGNIPPSMEFLERSSLLALGSDDAAGNNSSNMFNELKFTALLNKCRAHDPTAYPAWQVLRMATINSARAIGLGDEIGSLEVGKKADVIVIDFTDPGLSPVILAPVRNIVPNLVYAARGHEVETVIINGKVVVDDHVLLTVDQSKIVAEANAAAKRVCAAAQDGFYEASNALLSMMEKGYL